MEEVMAKKKFSRFGLSYTVMYWVYAIVLLLIMCVVKAVAGEEALQGQAVTIVNLALRFAFIYPLMYVLIRKLPKFEMKEKKLGIGKFIACFFITCALMYISNFCGTILNAIIGNITGKGIQNPLVDALGSMPPVMQLVMAVILAPIFEELLFRKFLIDRVVNYGEVTAMLVSGFMFGLYHGNLAQFVYAATIGMFFAFIYIRTGRIRYTIGLHMLVNSIGTSLISYLTGKIDVNEMMGYLTSGDTEAYMQFVTDNAEIFAILGLVGMFIIVAIIVGIILMIALRKHFVFEHHAEEIENGKRFSTVVCNAGMLVYVIFWTLEIVLTQFGVGVFDKLYAVVLGL